jgi:hypothetical protein
MAEISTGQKLAAVGRVALRQAGESRWGRAIVTGCRTTLGSFGRVLRLLLLEIVGFLFLAIAVIGGFAVLREYRAWSAGRAAPGRVVAAVLFCALFTYFGVTSFWRAWKK